MNLALFMKLVRGGEKSNVDFKLTCNAFNRSSGIQEKAKAELVKDICAMANNGLSTIYLIIGVGDDGQRVESVEDQNLSSQNIHALLRDSIHPRPVINLYRCCWPKAPKPFTKINFVVIRIGPNSRHAYRFSRDMIDNGKGYHFRKNEVWVRNGDTSDLATPEQIGSLLGRTRAAQIEPEPSFDITEYKKIKRGEQLKALAEDARALFEESGFRRQNIISKGFMASAMCQSQFRILLKIRKTPFLFRCLFVPELTSRQCNSFYLGNPWMLEHGILIFSIGAATAQGKFPMLSVDSKEKWGSVALLSPKKNLRFSQELPGEFAEVTAGILTLPNLSDTKKLRKSFSELIDHLGTDDVIFKHLNNARGAMNTELKRWSKKSMLTISKAFPSHSKDKALVFRKELSSVVELLNKGSK